MAEKSPERLAAEAEMVLNPDAPDKYFADKFKISRPTVSLIRRYLRERHLIPPSRRGRNTLGKVEPILAGHLTAASADPVPAPPQESAAPFPSITGEELLSIGVPEFTDENDEETRKRLLSRCRAIALDPDMHPDTVLSASQVYIKLKDAVRAKSLGPGRPVTHEDAVARLASLMHACGPIIVHEAITSAFGGTNAAKSSGSTVAVHSSDPTPEALGPARAPGSDPRTDPDEGSGRPSNMG